MMLFAIALGGWLAASFGVAEPPSTAAAGSTAASPAAAAGGAANAPEPTLSGSAPTASGPPVTVTTRLSPDPSHIGDLLELQITVAHPSGYSVNLPSGLRFDPLHLVRVEEGPVEPTGKAMRKTFRVFLQAFQLDQVRVPRFSITYVDGEGAVHTLRVPSKTFVVERLLANESTPERKGEDPMVSLEYPANTAQTIIYSALVTAILVMLGYWLWLRHRSRRSAVEPKPMEPPHVRARRSLAALEGRLEDLFRGDLHVLYYLELTEIAKHYLQHRFEVDALDRTTDEIRRSLLTGRVSIAPIGVPEVVDLLSECDLVKFARYAPPIEKALEHLEVVRSMIERTVPAETADEDAPADAESARADSKRAETARNAGGES